MYWELVHIVVFYFAQFLLETTLMLRVKQRLAVVVKYPLALALHS